MPAPAIKNALGAGTDLGLGDQLVQQLQDQEDQRKKTSPDQTLAGSLGSQAGVGGGLMAARSLGLV